ncbi:hypothetical protein TNCV_4860731 [Trichonephila clavipes]|nr:hypothetical protein TNCV_4860731 [Trichonephila clavipes]
MSPWAFTLVTQHLVEAIKLIKNRRESADCRGHPNTANSIEKDSKFRICNHCWRGEVRKTPNPVKIGNLIFPARFKLQSLPLMTESCKLEKSATCATLQKMSKETNHSRAPETRLEQKHRDSIYFCRRDHSYSHDAFKDNRLCVTNNLIFPCDEHLLGKKRAHINGS